SFVGSFIGILILAGFAPILASIAQQFQAPEYFALMVLGLLAAAVLGQGSPVRGVMMVVLGLLLGIVGTDLNTGTYRFVFDVPQLADGISLVAIAMGLFGVSEVIANAGRKTPVASAAPVNWRSMIPTRDDMRRSWGAMLRGTAIGAGFGTLPGTGASIASFVSYAIEKRIARDPSRFGKGAIEGGSSPEAANNSAVQTAFIPTLPLCLP